MKESTLIKLKSRLQKIHPSIIFLLVAMFFGSLIRLGPVLNANFPINDGGLFYTMTQELIANGFKIPQFTNYNHLQIPYAYPPFGFYLAGGIHQLTGLGLFDIFRIFPAIISILAIPAFYVLAKAMIKDDITVGISVLAFSFIPATMDWLIMGGGLSRAPGFVFSLLALRSGYLIFTRNRRVDLILTSVFSSLTVLFHPEAAIHTAVGIFIFLMAKGRNKKGFVKSIIIVLAVILMTSPWWLIVVKSHGFSPFATAAKTGIHDLSRYIDFLFFNLTGESRLTSIAVFGFIGLFIALKKSQWMLPVWILLTFIVDPRAANLYEAPIIAMLAGMSLSTVINQIDNFPKEETDKSNLSTPFTGLVPKLLITILLLQWIFSALFTVNNLVSFTTLASADIEAMQWVDGNTAEDSKFLVMSGIHPFMDAVSEWFPTITDRESIGTVQGSEWIQDVDFDNRLNNSIMLKNCILKDINCISEIEKNVTLDIDYIFMRKFAITQSYGTVSTVGLSNSISESPDYSIVHETDSILIYKVNPLN
jgi:hypothetical protein